LEIIIDIEDPVPLFTQLIAQIKQAILNKSISPGDPLPSIRQLANDLDVNNKTVAKAYRLLERDNVIQAKGYRGSFVHPDAIANCNVDVNKLTVSKLTCVITELKTLGVTDSEIRVVFGNLMNNSKK